MAQQKAKSKREVTHYIPRSLGKDNNLMGSSIL